MLTLNENLDVSTVKIVHIDRLFLIYRYRIHIDIQNYHTCDIQHYTVVLTLARATHPVVVFR